MACISDSSPGVPRHSWRCVLRLFVLQREEKAKIVVGSTYDTVLFGLLAGALPLLGSPLFVDFVYE
jgi:hypothetical protein